MHGRVGKKSFIFVCSQRCGELEKAYKEFERIRGQNEIEDLMLRRSFGNELR